MTLALRLTLRSLAAAGLVLVAFGVPGRSPFVPPRYVLVLDDSPSVRSRYPGLAERTLAQWRAFDGGAHPVVVAGSRPRPEGAAAERPRFTDLSSSLRAAAALGEPGIETRILLVTDGLSREDGFAETLAFLRERGARVWALTPPEPEPLAGAVGIVMPARVFLQEPFTVRAQVAATRPGPLGVRLLRDGEEAAAATVTIDVAGRAEVDFPQEAGRVGRVRYEVAVPGSPARPAAEVAVAQAPRVRWLSEDPGSAAPLVAALRDAGIPVEVSHPADLLSPVLELAGVDVVVLDDIPAAALGEDLVEAVRQTVAAGHAGLVVVGGRKGLGSGDYNGTAIETLLPVAGGFRAPPPPAAVSLVLALDTSFSMYFRGRGERTFGGSEPRKIDVAVESVRGIVRIIRPEDRFGILGNSTDIFWIARLGPVTDREALLAAIGGIKPIGAGIYFYSMLNEARAALRGAPAGIRHVLVLCDADDIDEYEVAGRGHAFDLIREMAGEGITVSIVAIGIPADKDVPFLRTAALLGRGDFYLVPRLVTLPRYFSSEYLRLTAARNFLEEEAVPALGAEAPAGFGGTLPPLSGIALVTARAGSRTLLETRLGPPLLVAGDLGRGRVVVFTGDNGQRWAGRWLDSAAARRAWLQILFEAAPAGERERDFDSVLEADPEADRLVFRYSGKGSSLPPWERLRATPAAGTAAGEPDVLDRIGLRTYRGRAPLGATGFRRVTLAEDAVGALPQLTAGYFVPPAEEDLPLPPRWGAIRRIVGETGGAWVSEPGRIRPQPGWRERLPLPLAVLIIAAAVSCLLAEVVVRTLWEE